MRECHRCRQAEKNKTMNRENLALEVEAINKRISEIKDPENRSTPIIDGIVDIDEYISSEIKILWVLKEVNSPDDTDSWDLRGAIKGLKTERGMRKGWGKTFNPIVYVTNGILTNRIWQEIEHVNNRPEIIDDLRKVAYVNLKKIPGGGSVKYDKLHNQYNLHKEILLHQIRAYSPDVIICGGTFGLIKNDLPLDNFTKEINHPVHLYYSTNQLIVDAYHPNQRTIGQELFCDSIINAVNNWKIKIKMPACNNA